MAQFHRAAKHKHVLSMKFLPGLKQDFQPNFHFLHIACYWHSAVVCLHPENHMKVWLEILFYQERNFMLSNFVVLSSSMKLGPEHELPPPLIDVSVAI